MMRVVVIVALLGATVAGTAGYRAQSEPADGAASQRLDRAVADSLGARTVRGTCLACHVMRGSPTLAPPFAMIAARYRMAAPSKREAASRMARYVRSPVADSSLMPAMVIERFGLMPALPLPDSVLLAAAMYVLDAAHGSGSGGGGGMQHRHP